MKRDVFVGGHVVKYLGFNAMRSSSAAVKTVSSQFVSKLLGTYQPGIHGVVDACESMRKRLLYLVCVAIDQHYYKRLNKSRGKCRS
jgi:hypothetical protein